MRVADLAAELEVPTSMLLDQCQRFGIDAAWAGAELSGADVVVLRSELASTDAIDLTPADPPPADPPAAAPSAPSAVPPTAVGSRPDLIDEVTPEVDPAADEATASPRAPGFSMGAGQTYAATTNADGTRQGPPRPVHGERRLERGARNSVIALILAVICFVGSNLTEIFAVVALLWFLTALFLCVAVVDGFRGRRRVQTHPERAHGVWVATIAVVLAIGGLIGVTAAVMGVAGDEAAADAPLGVGDLQSVQVARWGYQRVQRFSDNGWKQPAREEGTCWEPDRHKERDEQRVEIAGAPSLVNCTHEHILEAAKVFAVNRDADAPYPSTAEMVTLAQDQCGAMYQRIADRGVKAELKIEYPTEVGWAQGDHDVACVLVTPSRSSALTG